MVMLLLPSHCHQKLEAECDPSVPGVWATRSPSLRACQNWTRYHVEIRQHFLYLTARGLLTLPGKACK
jgi:hypothetical protein